MQAAHHAEWRMDGCMAMDGHRACMPEGHKQAWKQRGHCAAAGKQAVRQFIIDSSRTRKEVVGRVSEEQSVIDWHTVCAQTSLLAAEHAEAIGYRMTCRLKERKKIEKQRHSERNDLGQSSMAFP